MRPRLEVSFKIPDFGHYFSPETLRCIHCNRLQQDEYRQKTTCPKEFKRMQEWSKTLTDAQRNEIKEAALRTGLKIKP